MEASPAGCTYSVCARFDWILPSLLEACAYESYWIRRDAVYRDQMLRSGLVPNTETETQRAELYVSSCCLVSIKISNFTVAPLFNTKYIYALRLQIFFCLGVCSWVHEWDKWTYGAYLFYTRCHHAHPAMVMPFFFSALPNCRPPCLPAANLTAVTQSLPLTGVKYFT